MKGSAYRPELVLERLYSRVRVNHSWDHLRLPGIRLVPGVGSYRPVVMIVGDAPGATENTHGRPFCGAAGVALHSLMEGIGLFARDQATGGSEKFPETAGTVEANTFLTNVLKYRTPNNRKATGEETMLGRGVLRQEWAAVGSPRVVVALGPVAIAALYTDAGYPPPAPGQPIPGDRITLWPMIHPSQPLRQPEYREIVEEQWEVFGKWLRSADLLD